MSKPPTTPTLAEVAEAVRENRLDQAESLLAAALIETPHDTNALSIAFDVAMRRRNFALARTRAEAALAVQPDSPDAMTMLGMALMRTGDTEEAKRRFDAAIDIVADHFFARHNRGMLLVADGRFSDAVEDFRIAVRAQPASGSIRMALADALTESGQFEEATEVIRDAAKSDIGSQVVRTYVWGRLMYRMGRYSEARQAFAAVLSANPHELKHYRALSAASYHCADTIHAERVTLAGIKRFPAFERPNEDPALRVLVLEALGNDYFTDPGRGPLNYMQGNFVAYLPEDRVAYTHVLADRIDVLEDVIDLSKFDIVLNNRPVHERIETRGHAERVERMAADLTIPIINPPAAVTETTREANSKRFANAKRFIFPRTFRVKHELDIAATRDRILAELEYPFILRPLHTHFGHGVLLVENEEALLEFLRLSPFSDFYVIEYHDCRSSDGLFRRYRLACIGGMLYPDGVRADENWNVHNWEEGKDKWFDLGLDNEEEAYWSDPAATLDSDPADVFQEIVETTSLDVFGIDYGFRSDGKLIVFEVNAAMAIAMGGDLEKFPYRRPHCTYIRGLITKQLFEKAGKSSPDDLIAPAYRSPENVTAGE